MNQGINQLSALAQGGVSCAPADVPLKTRLEENIAASKQRLAEMEELKTLLEANPEIERVMTLLRNGGVY